MFGDRVCPFPGQFEMEGLGVPLFDSGRDRICGENSSHYLDGDPSGEVFEGILINYFTESGIVLELQDIFYEGKGLWYLHGG